MWNKTIFFDNLQFFAKKKGAGSTKNGRDSNPKYLGIKRGDGQFVKAGSLIYLQRGTKIHPGKNVKRARNDALFALIDGFVSFGYLTRKKRFVSVLNERKSIIKSDEV